MRLFFILAVSLLDLVLAVYFYYLISRKKIRPSLAMWVFFFLAISMSLFTYLKNDEYSALDNILNTADLFFVASVTLSILIFGDAHSRFNRFDKGCLIVVAGILVFWLFTQNHYVTNILVQGILVVAYFPVVNRMVTSGENHESYLIWGGMLLAGFLAIPISEGSLAFIYITRTIVSIFGLLGLMLYVDLKKRKKG